MKAVRRAASDEYAKGYDHTAYMRLWRCKTQGVAVAINGVLLGYVRRGHVYDPKGVRLD